MNPTGFFDFSARQGAGTQRGMVLVAVIALLIFLGLFCTVAVSLLTTSSGSNANLVQGAQALAIAQAGSEWYLETLRTDTNWAGETDQTRSFSDGNFTIHVLSAAATEVQFRSTGVIASTSSSVNIQRTATLTAQKLSPAFRFALYQGANPGANFSLVANGANPAVVTGDAWSAGSVVINTPNQATLGKVYVPDNQNVTGTGTYVKKLMSSPYLSMPVPTATYYTDLISTFNSTLDADASNSDQTVNSGTFTVSGTMNYRNFTTSGTVTIRGNGTIVANRALSLHSGGTSLVVTPDAGGTITFLANRTLTIGANTDPSISISANCRFYSRAFTSNTQQILVRGANTTISQSFLIGQRNITVQTGADILSNSTLFVNDAGSNTNNEVEIVGDPSVTTVQGSLISLSKNNPAIYIHNGGTAKTNVVVQGIVYAYGDASSGFCQLQDATIQGSVVCNLFSSNQIQNVAITYDPSYLPAPPPQGFENYVSVKPNAWDGL